MRQLMLVSIVIFAFVPAAFAAVPDPGMSSVSPWDGYGQAFVAPGATGGDLVTITVLDIGGVPCPGIFVQIDFSNCGNLCIDTPSGLSGTTGPNGVVVLDPRVGGCQTCPINIITGGGIVLRTYNQVTSPDWDGTWADGIVGPLDVQFFNSGFPPNPYARCADHDGNGTVDLVDASLFFLFVNVGAANTNICPNPAVCLLNCPQLDGGPTGGVGPGNRSPDINGDAVVNLVDLATLALSWPPGPYNRCVDYNCDGIINLVDLANFGIHWNHTGGIGGICY